MIPRDKLRGKVSELLDAAPEITGRAGGGGAGRAHPQQQPTRARRADRLADVGRRPLRGEPTLETA
jgi:hypothetical protein